MVKMVKKKNIVLFSSSMIVLLCALAFAPSIASAGYDCGGIPTSINFGTFCGKPGTTPVTAIILWVIDFLSIGVGVAVVIGIIFGGITYTMSDGEPAKAKQGKDIITNAIIGLFLFIFLFAAVQFLVPGGVFNK